MILYRPKTAPTRYFHQVKYLNDYGRWYFDKYERPLNVFYNVNVTL